MDRLSPAGRMPLGVNVAEHQVLGHGHGYVQFSGVAGLLGRRKLGVLWFCSETSFNKVEPTFTISTLYCTKRSLMSLAIFLKMASSSLEDGAIST